jgi:hypothetical protein
MDAPNPARQTALRRLDALSHLLDNSIRVPGTQARFGLDAVIGLIPGFGDAAAPWFRPTWWCRRRGWAHPSPR